MKLQRMAFLPTGIFGVLCKDDNTLVCQTLEHAYPVPVPTPTPQFVAPSYAPKIPPGIYTCERRHSPKFGYDVFWVTDVPNCSWIEIHIGNFNEDSEGCVLLGYGRKDFKEITNSKLAFTNFMNSMEGIDSFQLTVI